MDWRYIGQNSNREPVVFWVTSSDGSVIGMASLIFRRYWIFNKLRSVAVLGDISLDKEYRGRGIAEDLYHFVNGYMAERGIAYGFVIPNASARGGLLKAGWREVGRLVPHIFFFDPGVKLGWIERVPFTSKFIRRFVRAAINGFAAAFRCHGYKAETIGEFDESADMLWEAINKKGLVIGEKNKSYLRWRYSTYSERKFVKERFVFEEHLVGFAVSSINEQTGELSVYDLVTVDASHLKGMILAFLGEIAQKNIVRSVRVTLSEDHPYSRQLRRCGFLVRPSSIGFQVFPQIEFDKLGSCTWCIGSGDKDV